MLRHLLLSLVTAAATGAHAIPVEHRFTGTLSGTVWSPIARQSVSDVQFVLSIFLDTQTASSMGHVAGAGRGFFNNSEAAIWEIAGVGKASSSQAQIYSFPGLGRIGFSWNGQVFPLSEQALTPTHLYFNGNAIATDSMYGRLSEPVPPVQIGLQTPLFDPDNLSGYAVPILLNDSQHLRLTGMSQVSYSVIAVPEPSGPSLLAGGLIATFGLLRARRANT